MDHEHLVQQGCKQRNWEYLIPEREFCVKNWKHSIKFSEQETVRALDLKPM